MRADRAGFALIELLVALGVLGFAGLAVVELGVATMAALENAVAREREQWDAERLLSAYTLLSRRDLASRAGARTVGSHAVTIRRTDLDLFEVLVDDLGTVLYRPEGPDD